MKKQLLTFFTIVLFTITASSQRGGDTITYLTFSGSSTADDRFYAFSGSSSPADLDTMSGDDWTYETWIKVDPAALIGNRTEPTGISAGGATIMERRKNFELYIIDDDNADFAIKYNKLDSADDAFATGTMQSNESSVNLNFNEWVHVAISRSSADGIAKFYINGILIDSSNDALWSQPVNDTWLDFNYMYRGSNMNFFTGSMDNIRVSLNDRYPAAFTPSHTAYSVDANTLLQLDLDNNLTAFDPVTSFDKVEIKGTYGYYIQVINTTTWSSETLSLKENNTTKFTLYPNPTKGNTVFIQAKNNETIQKVALFNIIGKSVKVNYPNSSNYDLNVKNLNTGIYFVRIHTDGGIGTQKLIIE